MSDLSMDQLLELSDEELMKYEIPEKLDNQDNDSNDKDKDTDLDTEDKESDDSDNDDDDDDSASGSDDDSDAEPDKEQESDSDSDNLPDSDKLDKEQEVTKSDDKKLDTINYEEFYKKVIAPFKANGRTIQLDSPDDVITMLQKGANYTKKMQEIAPYRHLLMMLQKNDIVDEDKLSFLIDLDKKNPEAIKKLLKDAEIDPLEIDVASEPAYKSGTHRVTSQEAAFTTTLDEIKSLPNGQQTLLLVNSWDTASKNELFSNPADLFAIHEQKQSGVYDMIADEIEKQRILGKIPDTVPFLQAYKIVGSALAQQQLASQQTIAPVKLETKVQKPKQTVANDKKVKAASPSKVTNKASEEFQNPFSMSDEEFMQKYKDRL